MTTTFIYSNKVTTAPVNSQDTWLAIEDLQTEVELADGRKVFNGALSIQGAKFVDEGISIAVDLDLFVAFGAEYQTADGKHRHAGSAITLTADDVNAQAWERLVKYADACAAWTFNGRRLQLTGNKEYFFNFLVGKPQAYVAFDLEEGAEIEVDGEIYHQLIITNFSMSENCNLGISESADPLKGVVIKRTNPFAPAATIGSKPSVIRVPTLISAK